MILLVMDFFPFGSSNKTLLPLFVTGNCGF